MRSRGQPPRFHPPTYFPPHWLGTSNVDNFILETQPSVHTGKYRHAYSAFVSPPPPPFQTLQPMRMGRSSFVQ